MRRGLEEHFHCADCGVYTSEHNGGISEYYMIHNHLWKAAIGNEHIHMLCIGCLEDRLGRTLTKADFTSVPVNSIQNQSERLVDRLTTDLNPKGL